MEVKKTPWPWSIQSELQIVPNEFPPDSHSFLTVVDPPPGMASPGEVVLDAEGVAAEQSAKDLFDHVHSNVAPCLLTKASFSTDQVKDSSPLFEGKW